MKRILIVDDAATVRMYHRGSRYTEQLAIRFDDHYLRNRHRKRQGYAERRAFSYFAAEEDGAMSLC